MDTKEHFPLADLVAGPWRRPKRYQADAARPFRRRDRFYNWRMSALDRLEEHFVNRRRVRAGR